MIRTLEKHAGSVSLSVVATGGGAELQNRLWLTPGTSGFLVDSQFPYSNTALEAYLGFAPRKSCCFETTLDMAFEAFRRACLRNKAEEIRDRMPMGLAINAVTATYREHRGKLRAHGVLLTPEGCWHIEHEFPKETGYPARCIDGSICSDIGIQLLNAALGEAVEPFEVGKVTEGKMREQLLARPLFQANGRRHNAPHSKGNIFYPGAFNPFHQGHEAIAKACEKRYNHKPILTVSMDFLHKPSLTTAQALDRVAGIDNERLLDGASWDVMITAKDGLFVEKAAQLPGAKFLVGADTVERMLDPKWGNVEAHLKMMWDLGVTFSVADRLQNGTILSLDTVLARHEGLPYRQWLFSRLPFTVTHDISSSDIRNAGLYISI